MATGCDMTKDGFGGTPAHRFPSKLETIPVIRQSPSGKEFPAKQDNYPSIGYRCQECGFEARTAHGLARHVRVHGFGALGRHLSSR